MALAIFDALPTRWTSSLGVMSIVYNTNIFNASILFAGQTPGFFKSATGEA